MSASLPTAPPQVPHVSASLQTTQLRSHAAFSRASEVAARLLAGWHLLSLDAPTVAALWVVFIARCAHVPLPWTDPAAMFTAVWILYATDRLLDSRSLATSEDPPGLEARHRFHHRHRVWFYAGLAMACPLLLSLLHLASLAALRLNLLLGALLFAWLLLVHARPGSWSRLPKELAVGIFFPAAVFIPSVARIPALRPVLLPCALLFAAACSLNCLYIFAWEHPHSHHAHWSTRWAVQRLPQLTIATFAAALTLSALFACSEHRQLALPALASAGSTALLLGLHSKRHHLSSLTLRASADLCLLTPALLLPGLLLLQR